MSATFIHDGNAIDYTPASDVAAGAVVVQSDLVGIAKRAIPVNTLGALHVTGVFDLPKTVGDDIDAGITLYWDETNQVVSKTDGSGTHKAIGKTVQYADDIATHVRVRLSQ
jgi:predicted RecA/RadA family phage recombinase